MIDYNTNKLSVIQTKARARTDIADEVFEDIKIDMLNTLVQKTLDAYADGSLNPDEVSITLYDSCIIKAMLVSLKRIFPERNFGDYLQYDVSGTYIERAKLGPNLYHYGGSSYLLGDGNHVYLPKTDAQDVIDYKHLSMRLNKFLVSFGFGCRLRESRISDYSGHLHEYSHSTRKLDKLVNRVDRYMKTGHNTSPEIYSNETPDKGISLVLQFMAGLLFLLGLSFIFK